MKKSLIIAAACLISQSLIAQIQGPKLSPLCKMEQTVGLTDIKIEYYRPSKNNREVFGTVVPYNELWRTGANENTKITFSDHVVFGTDTLQSGTYALFTKPNKDQWEVFFYKDITNWGTPDSLEASKVALKLTAKPIQLKDIVQTFTIQIEEIGIKQASLQLLWDQTKIAIPFQVPTNQKMNVAVQKMMAGPSANDYYIAADFYFKEKKDLKLALEWVTKAVALRGEEAFWMLRLQALIQAELGDYKNAITTAKKSMESAKKAEYQSYVDMNNASIAEWSKKK